jgi:hypothetical protein
MFFDDQRNCFQLILRQAAERAEEFAHTFVHDSDPDGFKSLDKT